MSEAGKVVEAEKGRNLSPANLHIRLRVVETVVLISLILNVVNGWVANHAENKAQQSVDAVNANQPR